MQYLLTKEEHDGLIARAAHGQSLPDAGELQVLCTKIANAMPVTRDWVPDAPAKPWGCVLNKRPDQNPGYCDECPVQSICPNKYKEWSQ